MTALLLSAAGVFATLLPARFWPGLNSRGVPTFPVLSPFVTVCAAVAIGVPLFLHHLVVSAYQAQNLAAMAASRLPRRPDEEAVIAAAQTASLIQRKLPRDSSRIGSRFRGFSSVVRLLGE